MRGDDEKKTCREQIGYFEVHWKRESNKEVKTKVWFVTLITHAALK